MIGSIDPPQTLISNQSSHHEGSKQIIQKESQQRHANIETLEKTQNSQNDRHIGKDSFQSEGKSTFRNKLKSLKKKKENITKVLSNLQRGPKRIVRKCLAKYHGKSHEKREDEYKSQEQNDQFDSNEEEGGENLSGATNLKDQGFDENSLYHLTASKNQLLRKKTFRFHGNSELIFPIPEGFKQHFSVIRNHEGAKYFTPEFQLLNQEKEILAYCKKVGVLEFAFTLRRGQWALNQQSYIGKLVSNISGSILNLSIKIISKEKIEQRVVCSIEYTNNYLQFKKPRKLSVFMLDLRKANIEDKKYQKIASLRQIYQKDLGNSHVYFMQNRYPTYNKAQKAYTLDFHGRAPICSVKNFIIQEAVHRGRQYLLFGKRQENAFNLDFMHPLSMLSAFALAISSFNGKIICE